MEKKQGATVVKKILSQAMELSLGEARKLKKKMPGSVFVGTKGETDRLRHLLAAVGLKASISKTVS